MANEDNGSGNNRPDGVQRISISHDGFRRKFEMDLGGLALDDALMLLDRAHRELDARYRFQRGRELLAETVEQLQTGQLVQDLTRKGGFRS